MASKYREARGDGLPVALFDRRPLLTSLEMLRKQLVHNRKDESLAFLLNEKCPLHNQWLQNHTHGAKCTFVQLAALAAMNKMGNITMGILATNGKMKVQTIVPPKDVAICLAHKWQTSKTLGVTVGNDLAKVILPREDTCAECPAIRRVVNYGPAVQAYVFAGNDNPELMAGVEHATV
jgi:hypothetical protein